MEHAGTSVRIGVNGLKGEGSSDRAGRHTLFCHDCQTSIDGFVIAYRGRCMLS